jgi:hypothetical protein
MTDKIFPQSQLPIRRSVELLPKVFQTPSNEKFMEGVIDPLIQPGVLEKQVGYIGRRYGKTYRGSDVYIDSDQTLRSRYQLEPGVVIKLKNKIDGFYDYLDFKNQLKFFNNLEERDDLITDQDHYSWNPPIDWDKFVNYREYYWEPSGPPSIPISGQSSKIDSSYAVRLGNQSSYILSPDGFTNNPTIRLYRGQTYKFRINAPRDGFLIRTNYDTGSLKYNPNASYRLGNLMVYDEKLWRALRDLIPKIIPDISDESDEWSYVDSITATSSLDYNDGIINNGIENGILTFDVPYDSPDILFYQSKIDPDKFGKFIIDNIENNTKIDVEKEILGKLNYTSGNGIELTNGLIVEFQGQVFPEKYSRDTWLIEGVGKSIQLIKFSNLEIPILSQEYPEILFDNEGFDTEPFDDARSYPGIKDYITINRASPDRNPWSRYNRWFHRDVLEFSFTYRGQDFPANESRRSKRPIIEFLSGLQLLDHGVVAKQAVDYIEDFTTDVFSIIEGSTGYVVDGEELFDGARLLIVSDKDNLVKNQIYQIKFITHNNRRQISLIKTQDSQPLLGDGVLIKRGKKNVGLMYHYDGQEWKISQKKINVNQAPMFDVFDEEGISYSDPDRYPINNFLGSAIFSYKQGNGPIDKELGISISYLNINNVGDIEFNWDWEIDQLLYTKDQLLTTKNVSQGFYKITIDQTFENGWIKTNKQFLLPIIDSLILQEDTNQFQLTSIDTWEDIDHENIKFTVNGREISDDFFIENNTFIFTKKFKKNDAISVRIITDRSPNTGYYEIPVGLEKNPLNNKLKNFTLGQFIDHASSAVEFYKEFRGTIPGSSNIRNLDGYQQYAKRFMKHASLAPLSIFLLCDKKDNIIKSLQYSKKSYSLFKNNFIKRSLELELLENIPNFVDDIIGDLNKTKSIDDAFSDSDMIGSGAYTSIVYKVEDEEIRTFALSERFTLKENSRRAVYVYINQQQLLYRKDYEFNENFGFITIKKELISDDVIEIREYVSTANCFIPPTPTSMGLYKKYTPMKFLDDTYLEPRMVIQGHDGSITTAYGDFRDDLLLELEYRIYNNIKQEYQEGIIDIDSTIGGYYGGSDHTKQQLDDIIAPEFLKWIQNTDINYTANIYYQENEPFTYTYSTTVDPEGTTNLPGWWRGAYQWFYDTDRPHRCPWEMLGFSEKPDWWDGEYGSAPYTRNNLILWEDLRDGIIRQGSRQGQYRRYQRDDLLKHIPVDDAGKLLSPLDSGLANRFVAINNDGDFKFGDISPVEYAWRSSSEWSFVVTIAMILLKPFRFLSLNFDRTKIFLNKINQIVSTQTGEFLDIKDLNFSSLDISPSSGLVNYLIDYAKSSRRSLEEFESKIQSLDVNLSSRISGFVDKSQQKYLLDSKNPRSSSSSIFVPPENYDILFNVSCPISSVRYSGVIIEKSSGGWIIRGYDGSQPYFNYYEIFSTQNDPLISVGGVSEKFVEWESEKDYANGSLVRYRSQFYRSIRSHRSDRNFDISIWKLLPKIPTTGGVEALLRRNFNKLRIERLSYGIKLSTVQAVVDFLLGYQEYLKDQGFLFDRYDNENQVSQDWETSCKEFMFWTKHNWAIKSLISLSPAAEKLDLIIPVGVADSLLDSFYEYQIFRSNGTILPPRFIDVNRTFQRISIKTVDTDDGIYFAKIFYVLKEHVVIFSDRTVFNDVIYDKTTGYRQERIKTQGFRTVDWDGDYTSPGFLFDNVSIEPWQPFRDYKLGDIVDYQGIFWTNRQNHTSEEFFDESIWTRLDVVPEKQLISNFEYKINQFEDYYDVSSEGVGQSQRSLARHSIGYQERTYLQDLAEDPITQFQLYQGFIREKGTFNSIVKVFDKLSRVKNGDSVILNEEWAFRVGRFGGTDQLREIEFDIYKDRFELNPQPLLITDVIENSPQDQYYRIYPEAFTISDSVFTTEITPITKESKYIRTAGYVQPDQVRFVVKNYKDIVDLDIDDFEKNDHVWITFKDSSWDVMRFNQVEFLEIISAEKTNDRVEIEFNRSHGLIQGQIFGIRGIENLIGFFEVVDIDNQDNKKLQVIVDPVSPNPELDFSSANFVYIFEIARVQSYEILDSQYTALLSEGARLWIDNNGSNEWEVLEKIKQYTNKQNQTVNLLETKKLGFQTLYDDNLKQIIVSDPELSRVICYGETEDVLVPRSLVEPSSNLLDKLNDSFGYSMAISPDYQWLVISAPDSSNINSRHKGIYNDQLSYILDDTVIYQEKIYKATSIISPSTFDLSKWQEIPLIIADSSVNTGGFQNQGAVFLYRKSNLRWDLIHVLVSPQPGEDEKFGIGLAITGSDGKYHLAISAKTDDDSGKVYLYEYQNIWRNKQGQITLDGVIPTVDDEYGISIVYDYDGKTLVVGSPSTGNNSKKGLVFVYKLENNQYTLTQTLGEQNILEVEFGDQFGYKIDLDYAGSTLIVSSPLADFNDDSIINPGAVYVFFYNQDTDEFEFSQILVSYGNYSDEFFGQSISITANTEKIVIGASNTVQNGQGTVGGVYVFERKDQKYFLAEKLTADFETLESFGFSIDAVESVIAIGSPDYEDIGLVRLFRKIPSQKSLNLIAKQQSLTDISKVQSISLFDFEKNIKIQDLDYIDHPKLKILNSAEQELKFKTLYDPAIYNIGISNERYTIDEGLAWTTKHIGELWWDISAAKWIYHEQGDLSFRAGNWNQQVTGSEINVYEWVETLLLPSEWSVLADTNEGLAEGISGQPLYPDDDVYSIKQLFNPNTGEPTETLYYYWVRNKSIVPRGISGRRISARSVASLIDNPQGSDISYLCLVSSNQFLAYNFRSILESDVSSINIVYKKNNDSLNPIHNEYQLLTEGVEDSLPTSSLEDKWLDSLIGYDMIGNPIPDPDLSEKYRYGISFRPRQSMFVDRLSALKIAIENINFVLRKEAFADIINFDNLNSFDAEPNFQYNFYDLVVETENDLIPIVTSRIRPAVIQANLLDGELDSLEIIDRGFGYKVSPSVTINGDGTGARISLELDIQGRIKTATIVSRGKRYNTIQIKVREFSVLVRNDSTLNGFWSIYSWDRVRKLFYITRIETFDVRKYWSLVDWWKPGYDVTSSIEKEISTIDLEPTVSMNIGNLIRIKEYANGGWAVFEKILDKKQRFLEDYRLIGREKGTIKFDDAIYDISISRIGYDNRQSFDIGRYDPENFRELRIIFKSVKEDIFIGDYLVEWNKLFFSSIRYVFSEQMYVDWAFKTSFLNAEHKVGDLEQKLNYRSDSLASFQEYINEVKPYRTTVREYVSKYSNLDDSLTAIGDFDCPAAYSGAEGKIVPITINNEIINSYPWKWWFDNRSFSIVEIKIIDGGDDYTQIPSVLIDGDGQGVTARAFVANGKVTKVQVINPGQGFLKIPKISLIGGNGNSNKIARAIAILGNTNTRTFNLTVKFDRVSKRGRFSQLIHQEEFVATGFQTAYDLSYLPSYDKSKIKIYKNNNLLLSDDFRLIFYQSSGGFGEQGRVILSTTPAENDRIKVIYEKNDSLLDSVNRIEKHYSPIKGMRGKSLSQLMTGIDFGGVQVQGTTFEFTGGWDSTPWYSDSWDSAEPTTDFYYTAVGETESIRLPYIPLEGQRINIYIRYFNSDQIIRIDDPNYIENETSNSIPTFIGDGQTRDIEISLYITTHPGDLLIFRSEDSDGSIKINDPNLLDTEISGGTLDAMRGAYITARGITAEEILIEGGTFISPDHLPAPEENVPGQILDSVMIKVFQKFDQDNNSTVSAFTVGKDMLNINNYTRYKLGSLSLAKDLNYFDQEIEINDGDELPTPIANFNISGAIYINGERIEYLKKQGNILSQLRRGARGTSIAEIYPIGTKVSNVGYDQILPYKDSQLKFDFESDGTSLMIGPLDFIPKKSIRSNWYRATIPDEYGPCDEIEIFVAGRRLRKDPIAVFDEELGAPGKNSDRILEAEFSVDGETPYIRLTELSWESPVRITLIKRIGRTWYEREVNTASKGIPLLENDTSVARFIASGTTNIPE